MIGLDTNIFIRYIVRDDQKQASEADKIFNSCSSDCKALINQIVLVEIIWVLKRLYKYPKTDLLRILELLLLNEEIEVLNKEEAKTAMLQFETGNADFSDYYLSEINRVNGAIHTFTFDKKAAKSNNFCLV